MPHDGSLQSTTRIESTEARSNLAAIDLFCGAGGLSLGLKQAGFKVVSAIDSDPVSIQTYSKAIGDHARCGDMRDVSGNELLRSAGLSVGECSLLAGGPPCQGFSVQRRGDRKDERNFLVLEFLRLVEETRPHFFLMENVGGLLSKHGKPFLEEISRRAASLNYVIHIALLDAAEFGVPQHRKRAFLVGERSRDLIGRFSFPNPTHIGALRTVSDAIGDLESPPIDGSPHPRIPNHYREARLSSLNIERIRHVPPGGGRIHIPEHLQLKCHTNNPKHRHLDVYGRLHWDRPSVTLTARFDSFTRGRFGHPVEHRSITIREGARIQTFPDWFVFSGNREQGARQVGNAVPPLLAERMGDSIRRSLLALCDP